MERRLALGVQEISKPLNIPAGPAIARAMDQAASIGQARLNQRLPYRQRDIRIELRRRRECYLLTRCRIFETQLRGVQVNPRSGGASIECIAEDRKTFFGRMNTNLVCATRHRLGLEQPQGS